MEFIKKGLLILVRDFQGKDVWWMVIEGSGGALFRETEHICYEERVVL